MLVARGNEKIRDVEHINRTKKKKRRREYWTFEKWNFRVRTLCCLNEGRWIGLSIYRDYISNGQDKLPFEWNK